MSPRFVGVLLIITVLRAASGNRMRYYDCGGSPCKETLAICGEGDGCGFLEHKPQPGLEQTKLPGNPSVTLSHHRPACVATHHCHPVKTESVGGLTYTAHKNCCPGDPCSAAQSSTAAPTCILAAVAVTLAWLLPGLWSM